MWPFKKAIVPVAEPRRIITADGLYNAISGAGTAADKRSYNTFGFDRTLTVSELETVLRTSWLVRQVVGVRGGDMVKRWVERSWDGSDQDVKRMGELTKAEEDLDARTLVGAGVNDGRLYGGAAILLGLSDTDDLSKPLVVDSLGKGCIKYLLGFDRGQLAPTEQMVTEKDLNEGNFRMPRYYTAGDLISSRNIHHTRLLMFQGERLPYRLWLANGMWHDSVVQHILNDIKDLTMVMQQIASMYFEANVDVFKIADLADTLSMEGGREKIRQRYEDMALQKSNNRAILLDAQDGFEKKANSIAGLMGALPAFQDWLAGATRTPVALLFMRSAGGLNSSEDPQLQNYAASIALDQATQLRKPMMLFNRILCRHVFGEEPPNFRLTFPPLYAPTEAETADNLLKRSSAALSHSQVLGPGFATVLGKQLYEDQTYGRLDPQDLTAMETARKEAAAAAAKVVNPKNSVVP